MIARYLTAGFVLAYIIFELLADWDIVPGLTAFWLTPVYYVVGTGYALSGKQPPSQLMPRRLRWNLLLVAGSSGFLLAGIYAPGPLVLTLAIGAAVVLPVALVFVTVRAWRQARQMARARTAPVRWPVGPGPAEDRPAAGKV
jgi:hypothetical protein